MYIIFGVILFTAISCEKEVICPNNTVVNQEDNSNSRNKDFGNNDENEKSNNSPSTTVTSTNPTDSVQVITDPNRDEDDIKKDKQN